MPSILSEAHGVALRGSRVTIAASDMAGFPALLSSSSLSSSRQDRATVHRCSVLVLTIHGIVTQQTWCVGYDGK